MLFRFCYEVEFLIAKHKVARKSNLGSGSTRSPWDCPADHLEDLAILEQCRECLVQADFDVASNQEHGASRRPPHQYRPDHNHDLDFPGQWLLQPSESAESRDHVDGSVGLGVKLRSPFFIDNGTYNIMGRAKALWAHTQMRTSSTCRFNTYMHPASGPLGLLTAKKLATLILFLEQDLLLRLCPMALDNHAGKVVPLGKYSKIATVPQKGLDATWPADPLMAGIMDQYLPSLHDEAMQEQLQLIWGQMTLEDLAFSLRDSAGQQTAFALHLHCETLGGEDQVVAGLRYALWHPHNGLDVSQYWLELSACLMKAAAMPSTQFKEFMSTTDEIIARCSEDGSESTWWTSLLGLLGLSWESIFAWKNIVAEYGPGGQLSPARIDRSPALG